MTRGPGLVGALLVGVQTAKAIAGARAAAARRGRPPAGPRGRQLPGAGPSRAAVPVPRGQRRSHLPRRRARAPRLRDARPDAGRRLRRGDRQGRAAARPAVSRRPAPREARARRRPRRLRLPDRAAGRRAGLLVCGAEDRAALQGARPGRATRRSGAAPTSRPPTSTRSSSRWRCAASAASSRPGATRWRSAAASRRTGRCASASPGSARSSTSRRASCARTTRR